MDLCTTERQAQTIPQIPCRLSLSPHTLPTCIYVSWQESGNYFSLENLLTFFFLLNFKCHELTYFTNPPLLF